MPVPDHSFIEGDTRVFWELSQAVRNIEADQDPRAAEIDVLVDELEMTAQHTGSEQIRQRVPDLLARLSAARTRAGYPRLVSLVRA